MAAYRQVYDSHHLQADCQEPGSSPEPYARQSSMATFTFVMVGCSAAGAGSRLAVVPRPQGRRHRRATARIAAAAPISPSYSPGGARVTQGRRHGGAVLRRDRHARAAGHVAQGRPRNDVIGAGARHADARRDTARAPAAMTSLAIPTTSFRARDTARGPRRRRRVHVHVPQRRRARVAYHQARHIPLTYLLT